MSALSSAWSHVSSAREWLGRHRRSLLIAGGVGAASVCAWAYWRFKPMYDQLRAELRLMERMASDMNDTQPSNNCTTHGQTCAARDTQLPCLTALLHSALLTAARCSLCVCCGSLLHRFHHNLSVGDMTLRNFATAVKADIAAHFNVEAIRAQIKRTSTAHTIQPPLTQQPLTASVVVVQSEEQRERDKQHDLDKWNEFKYAGFARTVCAVYAIALLHAIIKLQLSVVSRYVLVEQTKSTRSAPSLRRRLCPPSSSPRSSLTPLAQPASLGGLMSEVVNKCYFGVSEWAQRTG